MQTYHSVITYNNDTLRYTQAWIAVLFVYYSIFLEAIGKTIH